jgi:hypothetical protein
LLRPDDHREHHRCAAHAMETTAGPRKKPREPTLVVGYSDEKPLEPPIDLSVLSPAARKLLDPSAPAAMRQLAAKGVAPGIRPGEALALIAILSESTEGPVRSAAASTLANIPAPLLNGALTGDLLPGVVALLAPAYARDAAVMAKLLAHPNMPTTAVVEIAALASEAVAELVATNEERLLANPAIIEKLYMNKATRMSTADRILELAVRNSVELKGIPAYKEAAAAIGMELIAERSPEPTPDDMLFNDVEKASTAAPVDPRVEDTHHIDEETGEEVVEDRFLPLHARLALMTTSQKIRRAMLGSSAERLLLVRDNNRLVAQAAVKSPAIQESEIVRVSASRNVSEDVLRTIALDREWTRSHQIKLNLTQNPRTPFAFASKLIPHLREHELKALAKSKNVTGAVAQAARQWLSRRNVKE